MDQNLSDALQALSNEFQVKLAVVETPEQSESATFEPAAPTPAVTPTDAAPTEQEAV